MASVLGMHCLPMSHKKEARIKLINEISGGMTPTPSKCLKPTVDTFYGIRKKTRDTMMKALCEDSHSYSNVKSRLLISSELKRTLVGLLVPRMSLRAG